MDQVEAVVVPQQEVLGVLLHLQLKDFQAVLVSLVQAKAEAVAVVQVPQELQEALVELMVMVVMDYRQL